MCSGDATSTKKIIKITYDVHVHFSAYGRDSTYRLYINLPAVKIGGGGGFCPLSDFFLYQKSKLLSSPLLLSLVESNQSMSKGISRFTSSTG